jgi:hypothetical protein
LEEVGPIKTTVFLFKAKARCNPKLSEVINKLHKLINAGNSIKLLPHPVGIIGDLIDFNIFIFLFDSLRPPKRRIFALNFS